MSGISRSVCLALAIICIQPRVAQSSSNLSNENDSCFALPSWFPRTPPPTNARPDPNSDCDFYRWAWQTFLFATQPINGERGAPQFLAFQTAYEMFGSAPRHSHGPALFIPGNLDSVLQPGSLAILVDRNGRAVYYATHLNSQFVKFIRDKGYTDLSKFKEAPIGEYFPKGSVELKSSWRVIGTGEDSRRFFTIRARIPLLTTAANGEVAIDSLRSREQTLALIGLHVVGVVEGHPEFIWATFEHDDNAPDLPSSLKPDAAEPVDSLKSWSLYLRGANAADCNKKVATLKLVDRKRQILNSRISVFREFVFGGDDDPNVIRTLNDSVHHMLPAISVWRNYSFMGAMWLNNPDRDFKESSDFNKLAAALAGTKVLGGDTKLSNTTMETFTQSNENCFSCHNTMAQSIGQGDGIPGKRLNMSHALSAAYMYSRSQRNKRMATTQLLAGTGEVGPSK